MILLATILFGVFKRFCRKSSPGVESEIKTGLAFDLAAEIRGPFVIEHAQIYTDAFFITLANDPHVLNAAKNANRLWA